MNLQIKLSQDVETLLVLRAKEAGVAVESYVLDAVKDRLCENQQATVGLSAEQFSEWLSKWAHQFPKLESQVDDSRDSIYAGCGE